MAPNSAVPIAPPIERKKVTDAVATPMCLRSTLFWTAVTTTCMVRPRPAPKQNMIKAMVQYGVSTASRENASSAPPTTRAPVIGIHL